MGIADLAGPPSASEKKREKNALRGTTRTEMVR
jgi:hypothetical protein